MRTAIRLTTVLFVVVGTGLACDSVIEQGLSVSQIQEGLTGCQGHASATIPASGVYYLTTFGDHSSDDGQMSCGSYTQTGSWYYAASRQRYGCGSRVKIEANGKCVVAKTDDYGPDECVERAVGGPIMDVSPLVSKHLFGRSGAGWSDRLKVTVTKVATSTALGPCSGSPTPGPGPEPEPEPEPSEAGCHSATLAKDVPAGTCVQSATDQTWYRCSAGAWTAGSSGCTTKYAWCSSGTLGRSVPPRTCVQDSSDEEWYQCGASGWEQPVTGGTGPVGACRASYPL
jgi:hypothetical protein